MAAREIVLDTETTGLDPNAGHRLVEIACVELINHLPSGRTFQRYLNPERDMPSEAFAVHGLSAEFLAGHPVFASVVADLLEFIGDAKLVIHNAEFDLKFVNAELAKLGFPALVARRAVDTVQLARRKFPGAPVSLDALCSRFSIDNSSRVVHGALLDAQLLAEVYLELIGGRQATIELVAGTVSSIGIVAADRPVRPPRPHEPSAEELVAHLALLQQIKTPLWLDQP
jgi:DNA polymerase III subunit epsilon